jgi:DNA-binding MarR family transcriptional regulator
VIAATEPGRELYDRVRKRRYAYFGQITAGLDDGERGELNRMLELLARNVLAERAGKG